MIVVLIHHTDIGTDESYSNFIALVGWTMAQPDVRVQSISQIVANENDLSASRLRINRRWRKIADLLPGFAVTGHLRPTFYASENVARPIVRRLLLTLCVLWGSVVTLAWTASLAATFLLLKVSQGSRRVLRYGALAPLAILLLYLALGPAVGDRSGVALAAAVGFLGGTRRATRRTTG